MAKVHVIHKDSENIKKNVFENMLTITFDADT